MNLGGERLTDRLWQTLMVVVAFAVILRLSSAVIGPAIGVVLWLFAVISVYMVLFGRHRR